MSEGLLSLNGLRPASDMLTYITTSLNMVKLIIFVFVVKVEVFESFRKYKEENKRQSECCLSHYIHER